MTDTGRTVSPSLKKILNRHVRGALPKPRGKEHLYLGRPTDTERTLKGQALLSVPQLITVGLYSLSCHSTTFHSSSDLA